VSSVLSPHAVPPGETSAPLRTRVPRAGSERALVVAPDVARRRLRARLAVWAGAGLTVLALFTLVQFHVLAAQSAFTLERLDKERTNEQFRYQRLREQVARSSSAEAVRAAALKLGMVPGPNVVQLEAPNMTPTATPASSVPEPLSLKTYADTKGSLGTNP
jgi:hypothetical protein